MKIQHILRASALAIGAGALGTAAVAQPAPGTYGDHGHDQQNGGRPGDQQDWNRDQGPQGDRRDDQGQGRDWHHEQGGNAQWHGDNGDRRDWGGDEHRDNRGGRRGQHCWTKWRHHHRVRVCR